MADGHHIGKYNFGRNWTMDCPICVKLCAEKQMTIKKDFKIRKFKIAYGRHLEHRYISLIQSKLVRF